MDLNEPALEMASAILDESPAIAEELLETLIQIHGKNHKLLHLLGLSKLNLRKYTSALECFHSAIEIQKTWQDLSGLSAAYAGMNKHHLSVSYLSEALKLNPDDYLLKNNFALRLWAADRKKEAVELMTEVANAQAGSGVWANLGNFHLELLNLDEAERCFLEALKIQPDSPYVHVLLGQVHHLRGEWKKGFVEDEWRLKHFPEHYFNMKECELSKLWDGEKSLQGKTILLCGEQGYGDMIQFARYAKNFKELGATVIVNCPEVLAPVIRCIKWVDSISTKDIVRNEGELPFFDYHLPLMSAPYVLKVEQIDGSPYIEHTVCENLFNINVGIAWAGNPKNKFDERRSIHLGHFKPLMMEKVQLVSLQKSTPLKWARDMFVVKYETPEINDFGDTMQLLSDLDLVICCDTAVAHLAGAMGVPVWVCLPYQSEWRWTLNGTATPWYNSMKLFRQIKEGDWDEVFQRVAKDLSILVKSRSY